MPWTTRARLPSGSAFRTTRAWMNCCIMPGFETRAEREARAERESLEELERKRIRRARKPRRKRGGGKLR